MDSQQNIPTSMSQTNIEITFPAQPKPSVKETPDSQAKSSLKGLHRLCLTKLGFILCTWIFVFAVLGLLIALMVFHFSHKDYSLSSLAGGLNYLALNLNTDPILQIKAVNPSGTCPENFEPFLIGKWPGINAGCNCPGDILRSGSCDSVIDLVCENIEFMPEIDLFKWDGPGWCIHRAKLDSEYVKKGDCPVNFKECSISICVREDLECPITSVSLTTSPMSDENFKYGSNYLNIFRDKDVSPLINFDITENDIPCFSLNQSPAGTAPYTLIRDYPQGCETYGPDNLFSFSIAHMTQEQVLRANNFSQKIFNLPNYMSTLQSTTSVLSGRKRVAISGRDDICANLELALVSNSGDAADHMNVTITVCSILALIFHIVLCLVILQKSCGKGLKAFYKSENLENWLGFFIVFALLESVILVVMTILVLCFHSTMISTKNYFTSLQHSSCFMTGQPQELVSDYNNVVDEIGSVLFKYSIALLIVSVGPFASVILSQTLKRAAK